MLFRSGKAYPELMVKHKVDFAIPALGVLVEAKGMATTDYRRRAKWLVQFWMPYNTEYTRYVVVKRVRGWELQLKELFN